MYLVICHKPISTLLIRNIDSSSSLQQIHSMASTLRWQLPSTKISSENEECER